MGEQLDALDDRLCDWIEKQPMFFVATADQDGAVNVSPKGLDSLRIVGSDELIWLNLTGSGNETAAHLRGVNRMTLMWCAFEGPPQIVRIYGTATTIHPRDPGWSECATLIAPPLGARQYFRVNIERVQTSCGYAVPNLTFRENRRALSVWTLKKGAEGIERYWRETNAESLDGKSTGI